MWDRANRNQEEEIPLVSRLTGNNGGARDVRIHEYQIEIAAFRKSTSALERISS